MSYLYELITESDRWNNEAKQIVSVSNS